MPPSIYQGAPAADSSDRLIVTLPLRYTSVVKPTAALFESLVSSHWRTSENGQLLCDNLAPLNVVVDQVNQAYEGYRIITILNEFRISDRKLTVSVIGTRAQQRQVHAVRELILKTYQPIVVSEVELTPECFIMSKLKPELTQFLGDLARYHGASMWITVNGRVVIVGTRNAVKEVENKTRLKIDDLNQQLFSDYIELESISLSPLVAGSRMANLKRIIADSQCNIYLPDLLPELYFAEGQPSGPARIYISGVRPLVLQAKAAIGEIITQVASSPFMKQITALPLKREMIIINYPHKFDEIMYETGCYISIPSLGYTQGSSAALAGDIITFQGNSIEEVDIAIDRFVDLLSQQYATKCEFTTEISSRQLDINKFLNLCDTLSSNSGATVTSMKVNTGYLIQTMGDASATRVATTYLSQLAGYMNENVTHTSVQVQIELPNKEREFIAGKKNGKLVKIANMSSVSVQLLPFSESNFLVELTCGTISDASLGLELFEEELPTSATFNVPESFHRQIIGVGGQTIQTIMRRFNVFIKFSNSFELGDKVLDRPQQATNFMQGFSRKDNVIIKCPAKNKAQVPLARRELEKLVEKVTENSYSCSHVTLTGPQWHLMTSTKFNQRFNDSKKRPTNFITELEKQTNSFIRYPAPEVGYTAPITLTVCGPETNHKAAISQLSNLLPYSYEIQLKKTPRQDSLKEFVKNPLGQNSVDHLQVAFLSGLVVPLRMLFNVELQCIDGSLQVLYYPSEFGYSFDRMRQQRLSHKEQEAIVNSDRFAKILDAIRLFLQQNRFEVLRECCHTVDILIESGESREKENTVEPAPSKRQTFRHRDRAAQKPMATNGHY